MKLSKIYKRYTFIVLLLVLVVGSLSHYLIITHFIRRSADHTLREYRQNIEYEVAKNGTVEIWDNPLLNNSRLTGTLVAKDVFLQEYIRDTIVYSEYKKENVVFRLLSYTQKNGNDNFLITLWQSTVDTEDILGAVAVSLIILFILFTLFSFWQTKWFVAKLWHPFYQILEQLKEVDLISLHAIQVTICQVDEFNILKRTLNRMIDRIQGDYLSLRELTENTSHELQTPLSVVKARLELLQQSEGNSEKHTELIRSVSSAVDHIIRLNRFMFMIAKINSDQFPAENPIKLNDFLNDFLSAYEDIIEMKGLTIQKQYTEPLQLNLHPQLAEMLASNVLSNAIRYNTKEGYIRIETTSTTLQVYNSYNKEIPEGDLFARFKKCSTEKEATGLGLAIVKSICQKNNLHASIRITDEVFCLEIQMLATSSI
ncbi:MAG: HAMP domain-containing sensor histidine kinase [Odoribacter sp.]